MRREWRTCQRRRRRIRQVRRRCGSNDGVRRLSPKEGGRAREQGGRHQEGEEELRYKIGECEVALVTVLKELQDSEGDGKKKKKRKKK